MAIDSGWDILNSPKSCAGEVQSRNFWKTQSTAMSHHVQHNLQHARQIFIIVHRVDTEPQHITICVAPCNKRPVFVGSIPVPLWATSSSNRINLANTQQISDYYPIFTSRHKPFINVSHRFLWFMNSPIPTCFASYPNKKPWCRHGWPVYWSNSDMAQHQGFSDCWKPDGRCWNRNCCFSNHR